MVASLDTVLVAMPRTDDVHFRLVIFHSAHGVIFRNRLEHSLHDAPLTDRARSMGTPIVPSVKLSIDPEDPDLHVAADDHLAVTIVVVRHFPGVVFRHPSTPSAPRPHQGFEINRCADAERHR